MLYGIYFLFNLYYKMINFVSWYMRYKAYTSMVLLLSTHKYKQTRTMLLSDIAVNK